MEILEYAKNNLSETIGVWFGSASLSEKISLILLAVYIACRLLLLLFRNVILWAHSRAMRKQGILLLKKSVSDIKVKCLSERNFSFITDDLEGTPIEQRDTFIFNDPKKIKEFQCRLKKLRCYYQNIKKEIKAKRIPPHVLSERDIDYILQHVITEGNIRHAFDSLNDKRKKNDASMAFIGDKVGLYGYDYNKDKMIWECYQSDHFTWRIFKELYLMDEVPAAARCSPHRFLDELCLRLKKYQANQEYRTVLMHTLCYLFSSLGIDILIVGKDCKNHRVCLASVRSACVDRSHTSRIHVSVDEAFSNTDQEEDGFYTVKKWVRRGVEEEIGIPEDKQAVNTRWNKTGNITYTDFSIVLGYGEIGLSAIMEEENMDTLLAYPGKDKALESDGMFLIRIPGIWNFCKILLDLRNGVRRYVGRNSDSTMGKLPWVEFAPPIYFRTFLRKLSISLNWKDAFLGISIISATVPFALEAFAREEIPKGYNYIYVAYFIFWIINRYTRKYTCFSLWVPLWNGNVKALQTTGRIVSNRKERNVNNGLYMMGAIEKTQALKMSELKIEKTPLCAVRKSLSREEVPISFYQVGRQTGNGDKKGRFRLLSIYYEHDKKKRVIYYYVIRRKSVKQKRPSILAYSFDFGRKKDYTLAFDKNIGELDIERKALECYFGLHDTGIENHFYCNEFPEEFNHEYQLCDLYEYKEDYYWSAFHKQKLSDDISGMISMLYRLHVVENMGRRLEENLQWHKSGEKKCLNEKNARNIASYQCVDKQGETIYIDMFRLESDSRKKFEKKVNHLVGRSLERLGGKMSELEVAAVQNLLIRDNIFVADIGYGLLSSLSLESWKEKADGLAELQGAFQ